MTKRWKPRPQTKPLISVQDIIDRRHEMIEDARVERMKIMDTVARNLCGMIHGSMHIAGISHTLTLYDQVTGIVVTVGDLPRELAVILLRNSSEMFAKQSDVNKTE